jgi:hypothetical protein
MGTCPLPHGPDARLYTPNRYQYEMGTYALPHGQMQDVLLKSQNS